MTESSLGAELRQLRRAQGLTQKQLAEKSGVNNVTISRLENGQHEATVGTLAKLAIALGQKITVTILDLLPEPNTTLDDLILKLASLRSDRQAGQMPVRIEAASYLKVRCVLVDREHEPPVVVIKAQLEEA